MAVSRVIEVSFGRSSVALVRIDTAYFYNNGIIFKPTDIDLPASYQVHWADSPQATSTLETIGTAEGAPIPDDLWNRSRVIYGWIYLHPTEDSSVTGYEVRIYKNVRAGLPDGTEPTPAEQSTIDQLIGALNSAVEQTSEDVERAELAKDNAESARDNARTYASNAQESAQASASSAESASQSAQTASEKATASAQSASASAQIKADVEDLADDAQSYAESALIASQASVTARDTAQGYANSASASAQSASGYASNAQTSANTASSKATEASTSAQTASQKATESAQGASQALSYKTDAESAKTASQTAQGLAESARDTAVSARDDAESARDDAVQAKEDAESAVASISGALDDKAPVITDTASGSIASFSDGADDLPLKSLVVDINPIQDLSHGDPSPENICPISGWTEVDVEQSGVNVWDGYIEDGALIESNGEEYPATSNKRSGWISVSGGASYYFRRVDSTIGTGRFFFYDANRRFLSSIFYVRNNSFTIPSNASYMRFWFTNLTLAENDISINYPSTDHDYHPYTGRSITINLGQTVYGGHLDVVSGELVIDRAMVDLGTLRWYYIASRGIFEADLVNAKPFANTEVATVLCSQYVTKTYVNVYNNAVNCSIAIAVNSRVYVYDSAYADVTAFKTAMGGVMACYELATPIEIQLTPNQINSLLGVNNLWADSGDTEVEYRADTKLFIERLTAPDSADMVADANITSGQYFMVGNSLYKATANIANGGQITVGTNCTRVSLAQALNEINA